jgi:hypothetical protein
MAKIAWTSEAQRWLRDIHNYIAAGTGASCATGLPCLVITIGRPVLRRGLLAQELSPGNVAIPNELHSRPYR